ncbi:MAG: tetratricopeptide repeat protein [Weeksellaceae bacterium]
MTTDDHIIAKLQRGLVYLITFTTPFFFLPVTRDFLIFSKFYFFIFAVALLLILSLVRFIMTKKFVLVQNIAAQALILLVLSYAISVVLMSFNKVQAIFNPQYGLVLMVAMVVYYLYASQIFSKAKMHIIEVLGISAIVVSLISTVAVLLPAQGLPSGLSFLQNKTFNTIGSSIQLISFYVFILVGMGTRLYQGAKKSHPHEHHIRKALLIAASLVVFFGLVIQAFYLSDAVFKKGAQIILPPFSMSWYAAVEVLKNPLSALFGVGVDNFAAIYTKVRTLEYNLSPLWQINAFSSSRSVLLHIFTENGLLGLVGFGLFLVTIGKQLKRVSKGAAALAVTAIIITILLPPSLMSFFMLFTSFAIVVGEMKKDGTKEEMYEVDLSQLVPIYIGMIALTVLLMGGSLFFMTNNFLSEIYYKKALDGVAANSLAQLYDNQQAAIRLNPYNEDLRMNFSQTNLIVANNIAGKDAKELTQADRETITQAIQASIEEAKAAVALNPQKVMQWQNLANIYRQIINVADNAPSWTVSSYQQALTLDPQNPIIRLELGGVFYLLQDYQSAQRLFEQAVVLKPDWANAHYNLAWSYYQNKQYDGAVEQMQLVLGLLDPAKEQADYKQAQKDLAEFQKAREANQPETEQTTTQEDGAEADLTLPTPPVASVEPKLDLPDTASPEATVQE